MKRNINQVLAGIMTDNVPAINIQEHNKLGPGVHHIRFTTERDKYTQAQMEQGIERMFSGAFSIADGTLYRVPETYCNMYRAVIVANTESHEFNDENCQRLGLQLTVANVFVDPDDMVWKVVGDGDDKRLVLTSVDDYDKILACKRAEQLVTASVDSRIPYGFGDYVLYYDGQRQRIDGGYAVNASSVLSRSTGEVVEISPYAVIEAAVASSLDHNHLKLDIAKYEETAMDKTAIAAFLDYWRQLYANTPVYTEIEKMMRQYAVG